MKQFSALMFGMLLCSQAYSNDLNNLSNLTNLPGVSGFEKPVREMVKQQWQPWMQSLVVDGMGNLIGQSKKNQSGPRLVLMAHMDEVGFMVESITPDGFLRVIPLGGVPTAVSYAQRWTISTPKGPVSGYSGMDSTHLLDELKKSQIPNQNALIIDIGAENAQQAANMGVRPGLGVTPSSQFTPLTENRILAKALDDRIGLALISDLLPALKQQPNQLFLAATVQEEVGLRGASTVFEKTHADIGINIEIGIADDYPLLLAERKGRIGLGKGPTLFVYDKSMIPNQALLSWILSLAEKNNIPVQLEVETGYGEDGAKLQASGPGVPTINIGIPIRYAHQQGGVFDKRDYEQAITLVRLIVENLDQKAMDGINS